MSVLSWHGPLADGVSRNSVSTLSHRSEVTETCPGRENQRILIIGSIFVIAAVMGDFVTVNILGGGQIASVGKAIVTELSYLQFPPADANAMVLLMAVLLMLVLLTRLVDIRKEL